ncbi:MAG: ATP-dependent DNA helicase RecG, partial [Muribaculaceae bacterium]|nr:ATP-dependent DNA helicase RecG [Muribaculaceae bacterium]
MLSLRNFDIKYIKGLGPKRAELLASELGIRTAYDLLHHFPTGYLDRSRTYTVRSLNDIAGESAPQLQVKGRFISFNILGEGARMRLVGLFTDGTATMEAVWFKNVKGIRRTVTVGQTYVLFGKPTRYYSTIQMAHPEIDVPDAVNATSGLHGIYPLTERLRQRGINSRVIYAAISNLLAARTSPLEETLPEAVIQANHLTGLDQAIRTIHMPSDPAGIHKAQARLKFEELFYIQVDMLRRSRKRKDELQGYYMPRVGRWFNDFYSQCLPFDLTGAQKRVIKEIRADIMGSHQMNRLVQGDVGSGKTLVALLAMLLAVDNGFQACMMAPTEILATQHFETISGMTARIGLNVRLLTGSTKTTARREIASQLADGSLHLLIGTHAVIEDSVEFSRLGFVVIDEQHRFGVAQRARLWAKSRIPPHVLVMTATPIPRTLAMTVYGDLDVSVIDELPPGRKPVETVLRYDNQRAQVNSGIRKQLEAGHQIYIVYPLIEENEKLDLRSLEEGYEATCRTFPDVKVAFVHGKMKPQEKDAQMALFASGEASILVATT